jgi:hypothetical protein
MPGSDGPASLGERLRSLRLEGFVGRGPEIRLFGDALASDVPAWSVLFVCGPGGVGKSALLDVLAARAEQGGATVVRVDGRVVAPSTEAVESLLADSLGLRSGGGPIASGHGRLVLLVDAFEHLAGLDGWLRRDLLPRLPATALVVFAGRAAPDPIWRTDPAWHGLVRIVSLRNLSADESRELLRQRGVPTENQDRIIEIAHGHPLGLSLLVDAAADDASLDPATPDLVGTLLRRFLDTVPDREQRRALEVCALSRVTTESLLRDVVETDDAHGLFQWLRSLSFVEAAADGLFPHDLARDVLDIDLRWRDPDGYQRTFRRVRAHIHRNLLEARGRAALRATYDEKFVFRNLPSVLTPVDWESWGEQYPEMAQPDDRREILDLVDTFEGPDSAAIADRWMDRQFDGFVVVREPDGALRGFLALLDLTAAAEAELAADPGAWSAWQHANARGPVRRGETVTQTRFLVDAKAYQGPSPTLNATPVVTLLRYLRTPRLAFDFLTLAEPDRWNDYFALADLPRVEGADFRVGERTYGLYCHDFRSVPVDALLELWTDRALAQEVTSPRPRPAEVLVLSETSFAEAVRRALRDLHRADLLARNPLLRTRLLRERTGAVEPTAADLGGTLREAVASLREDPKDDNLLRAVEATYVKPSRTQEAAATVLGLAFSTYRRHLSLGVSRVVAWCWEREINAPG